MRRIFLAVLVFAAGLTLCFASVARAAVGDIDNPVLINIQVLLEPGGDGYDYVSASKLLTLTGDGYYYTIDGAVSGANPNHIKVADGITVNVTFDGLNITSSMAGLYPFDMSGGTTVNLTLINSNTLTATSNAAGLLVPSGSNLNITAASTGSLNATGGMNGAGIGGGNSDMGSTYNLAGNISIRG